MKKLLILLSVFLLTVACSKDNNGRLDPDAMISLRCAPENRAAAAQATAEHLTALQIVQQAREILMVNKLYFDSSGGCRGFADAQRDYANERLLMWGTDIIAQTGEWDPQFIESEDIVIIRDYIADPRFRGDTIAYIPNATLRSAYTAIRAAYDREDYTTVYKLFDTAFTFIPITGAEWQALKKQGLN